MNVSLAVQSQVRLLDDSVHMYEIFTIVVTFARKRGERTKPANEKYILENGSGIRFDIKYERCTYA